MNSNQLSGSSTIKEHEKENVPVRQPDNSQNTNENDENIAFVICDTCIFMHQMPDVWQILNTRNCKLYLPWKIHQELDGLKKHYDTEKAKKARHAALNITFILENFAQKVSCQDRLQYNEAKSLFAEEDSDDSILQAIIQLQNEKGRNVYLHTRDRVLKNKALSNGMRLFANL